MSAKFILAIDQGTTGSTALIIQFSRSGSEIIGKATVDFPQYYPKPGWVEHDLNEIWDSVSRSVSAALKQAEQKSGVKASDLSSIGITNQRETLCIFDRKTSAPLHRGIVWQCKRSQDICNEWRAKGVEAELKQKTGLLADPYFSGSKLAWVIRTQPDIASKLQSGTACAGTIDTYLLHRLSGGAAFATEPSNASRTLLYDIHKGAFDAGLLELAQVPNRDCLPEVRDSAGIFGKTQACGFLPDGIPIAGMLGDQQAALAGQTCFEVGEAKCTYGTGSFLLLNTGSQALTSSAGLLTTVAWQLGGKQTYAFEGSAFIAGAAIQFMRDQFQFIGQAPDTEAMADGVVGAPEIVFVPALAGLGAPHWQPEARGAVLGLTRGTTRSQVIRAALESMAFQVCDLVAAMNEDFKAGLKTLRVDGGAAANNLLMQIQADYVGVPVDRPVNLETTAFGAAMFAGLGAGVFASLDDVRAARNLDRVFEPDTGAEAEARVKEHLEAWQRGIRAVKVFAGKDA